jgi:hypothetical protein
MSGIRFLSFIIIYLEKEESPILFYPIAAVLSIRFGKNEKRFPSIPRKKQKKGQAFPSARGCGGIISAFS